MRMETWRADGAEACRDGLEHPVADVRAADAGVGYSAPGDDLAVVGIDDEGGANLTVPTAELEAVGTPTQGASW